MSSRQGSGRDPRTGKVGRSKSSAAWLKEHFTDPFVQRAHKEGWRSRAVFKLEEIDQRERLFRQGMTVLDLGAAPGAWSQYAIRRIGPKGRLVASDILPMDAIAGVEFVQGDFREQEIYDRIQALTGERSVDLVLSDMAPNMSGMDAIDMPRSIYLAELAVDMAALVLKPGGSALMKLFQGSGFEELVAMMRKRFKKLRFVKPEASRARSTEIYLLASGLRLE
ncbi:MAG: 23S rRNA (uridine(2552)-2'-O)-methyltransferase RlmE [Steroidobacteraceae bacterium]